MTDGTGFNEITDKHRWPDDRPHGVALCLSGGGFRATLFHLGALRRLHELGILAQVDTIASVSGGSIMSAWFADRTINDGYGTETTWNNDFAESVHHLTSRNLRTGPIAKRLIPYNWGWPPTAVEAFAARLEKEVTRCRLHQLPDRPRFVFCATDMEHGDYWTAQRDCIGSSSAGYRNPGEDWPVAYAVAASACFPPIFAPLVVEEPTSGGRDGHQPCPGGRQPGDEIHRLLHLSNGGNFDNTGMEAVWRDHTVVLVSDGGGTFDPAWNRKLSWKLQRYSGILDERSRELTRRWFFNGLQTGAVTGAYWGLDHPRWPPTREYREYPEKFVEETISEIRTDLDAFNEGERKVLENHGYLKADAAVQTCCPELATTNADLEVPWADWFPNSHRVTEALRNSHKSRALWFGGRW